MLKAVDTAEEQSSCSALAPWVVPALKRALAPRFLQEKGSDSNCSTNATSACFQIFSNKIIYYHLHQKHKYILQHKPS